MSSAKNAIRDNYNSLQLMAYLREEIGDAGFSGADVEARPTGTTITVHVTRPGLVIGRKGEGIRRLTDDIATKFGYKEPRISVKENTKPELSPTVMCNRVAAHIKRGTAFRRAVMWTMRQVMAGGAKGVQITASGKLRGDRSAFEKRTIGVLPRAGAFADAVVEEDIVHVETPMGLIGIRIRIAREEEYRARESFEMKAPRAKRPKIRIERAEERPIDPKEARSAGTEAAGAGKEAAGTEKAGTDAAGAGTEKAGTEAAGAGAKADGDVEETDEGVLAGDTARPAEGGA